MELENLVQVGTVSAVDTGRKKARVTFPDGGNVSGWLSVLQHTGATLAIQPDGEHDHEGATPKQPDHEHPQSVLDVWLPRVGEAVLVLYLPVPHGDGFILGGF